MKKQLDLKPEQIDRVIEMAWEDRTPFDAILDQFGLKEQEVITLMRREMKESSFSDVAGTCSRTKNKTPPTKRPRR